MLYFDRPPKAHKYFLNEFANFLVDIILNFDKVIILGDFNIHECCPANSYVNLFTSLIDSFDLIQWVKGPTHLRGHTLDLVLTLGVCLSIEDLELGDFGISDHKSILFSIPFKSDTASTVKPMRWSRILTPKTSGEFSTAQIQDLSATEHLSWFNTACTNILDEVAPLKIKYQKPKFQPWVNEAVWEIRRTCRRAERKWKKYKLQVSYEPLRDALSKFQWAMRSAKSKYFADLIERNCNDPRTLFKTIYAVVNPAISMPHQSITMCENFLQFFVNKIKRHKIEYHACNIRLLFLINLQ